MTRTKTSVEVAFEESQKRQTLEEPVFDISGWPTRLVDAWVAMGFQRCAGCGWPMVPAYSGGDQPGYRGFEPCPCGQGNVMPRPRRPELADLAYTIQSKEKTMDAGMQEKLDNWFGYHAPTPEQIPLYERIRKAGLEFARVIAECAPPSADQTAAIRKVREAVMTANAAIACGGK